ncbi:hypothetical protein DMB66_53870 [Actinoplanes sp. ATCC 53533]|nr:hypothetical protein DMB66_53870 [Actinoplanes sp. ATCC 53533]
MLSMPLRKLLSLVAMALGLCVASLLAHPAPAGAAATQAGMDKLVLTWVDGGERLQVGGYAYRPKAIVEIRLGSEPIQQVRADATGRVEVAVPQALIAAGQSGASIIVMGRAASGASRVLISAVPPRAAARGPVDALPWSVAVVAIAGIGLGMLRRRRRGPVVRAAVAPVGYHSLHRA